MIGFGQLLERRAAKRAGIDLRIYHHLFRHSFATHALEDGVNIKALQAMMGHGTVKMTEIYTHIGGKFIKKEGEKIRQSRRTEPGDTIPNQKPANPHTTKAKKRTA